MLEHFGSKQELIRAIAANAVSVTFSGGDLATATDATVKVTVTAKGGGPDEPDPEKPEPPTPEPPDPEKPQPPIPEKTAPGPAGSGGTGGGSSVGRRSGRSSSGSGNRTAAAKTAIPASALSWDGRTLVINHDGVNVLGLTKVLWDNAETDAYSAYQGSVIVRFDRDFLSLQKPGTHTVRVEFLNHVAETTVAVDGTGAGAGEPATGVKAQGNNTYNPSTGGYPTEGADNPNTGDTAGGVWTALLLGGLGGAALVWYRRLKKAD